MRKLLIPVAAIALLAGCKGNAPDPAASDAATVATPAAAEMPALPDNAKATASVPGSYASNGSILVLGADDSAVMTDAAGKVTKGKWAWYSDGRRILLTADKSVWAVADGALYKMADKDAPLTGMTTDQIWAKAK
ncbi:hypothetical protein [Novosphingobium sp.]|uniref:hypothetical protein n=1 Tax=Novosphingobium sp. TaxID=1874826 RepID=UPI0025EE20B7|nr:hypothetical protein [Novosphingobium sp.]